MDEPKNDFEALGKQQGSTNPLVGIWKMLMDNKKWWMVPIIVILIMMGVLIFLGGSAAAPFIYTLF